MFCSLQHLAFWLLILLSSSPGAVHARSKARFQPCATALYLLPSQKTPVLSLSPTPVRSRISHCTRFQPHRRQQQYPGTCA